MRSRAAAGVLQSGGFTESYSMQGGINAWHGMVAEGVPEAGMAFFSSAVSTEEMIALSWMLEDGNLRFYTEVASLLSDDDAKKLFGDLASAEEHHKASLLKRYLEISGAGKESGFPDSVIGVELDNDVMEGGMSVTEALKWAEGKALTDVLELSMALETNAYDLYLKMERETKDDASKKVFSALADEEKQHLNRFSSLLEKSL